MTKPEQILHLIPTTDKDELPSDCRTEPANDFRSLALALYNQGFHRICPLNPLTKTPAVKHFMEIPHVSPERLEDWANQFPDAGIGVLCNIGFPTLVLDIDREGILETIEADTGRTFPSTYTVASRLDTEYRRHFYFTHTEYSKKHLRKTINGDGFDLKINGFVVGAGTLHEKTHKPYTIVDSGPPEYPIGIPVPDWLVDWLVEHNIKGTCERTHQTKLYSPAIPRRAIDHGKGELIPKGCRWATLQSKAGTWASSGQSRESIFRSLCEFVENSCEDGKAYLKQHYEKIRALAHDPTLKLGVTWVGDKVSGTVEPNLVIPAPAPTRHELLIRTMRGFPESISAAEGYERLQKALREHGYDLDKNNSSHQVEVCKLRRELNYTATKRGLAWYWIKAVT